MKCKSIIEIEKELRKEKQKKKESHQPGQKGAPATWRWQHLLSWLVTPTGTKGSLLSRLPDPGQKDPLLSRPGVPGWETGTTRVSQSGQISVSVVVSLIPSDDPTMSNIHKNI